MLCPYGTTDRAALSYRSYFCDSSLELLISTQLEETCRSFEGVITLTRSREKQ